MNRHNFISLFNRAVSEWPETLNLAELEHQGGGRYSVVGLGKQLEQVEAAHIGTKEEVIWRELHWAIFSVIHAMAKDLLALRPSDIRAEAVQRIFEQRLQSAIAARDPAWSADDFALAQAYLRENACSSMRTTTRYSSPTPKD